MVDSGVRIQNFINGIYNTGHLDGRVDFSEREFPDERFGWFDKAKVPIHVLFVISATNPHRERCSRESYFAAPVFKPNLFPGFNPDLLQLYLQEFSETLAPAIWIYFFLLARISRKLVGSKFYVGAHKTKWSKE